METVSTNSTQLQQAPSEGGGIRGASCEGLAKPPPIDVPQEHTETYHAYRRNLQENRKKTAENYDKWLLSGAGATIAFSMTFFKDFLGQQKAVHPYLLLISWILLGIAMGLILWNMQYSYVCFSKCIRLLDKEFKNFDATVWDRVNKGMDQLESIERIEFFNWVSVFLFFAGVVMIGIFDCLNM